MAFNKLRRDVQSTIEGLMLQPEVEVDKAFLRRLFERVLAALGGPVADMHQFRADAKVKTMAEAYSGSGPEDISAENRLQMGTWAEVEEEAGPDAMLTPRIRGAAILKDVDPARMAGFTGDRNDNAAVCEYLRLSALLAQPHVPTDAEWTDLGRAPLPVGRIDLGDAEPVS